MLLHFARMLAGRATRKVLGTVLGGFMLLLPVPGAAADWFSDDFETGTLRATVQSARRGRAVRAARGACRARGLLTTVKVLLPAELEYVSKRGTEGMDELARRFAETGEEHVSRAGRQAVA
jgi:hypothetical protein